MLSFQTLFPHTLELLTELSIQPELEGMRLVGGTSLALQYGHRRSIDLDFFGHLKSSTDDIVAMAMRVGECQILNRTDNIVQMTIDTIKVDVVNYYCYEWIDDPIVEGGIVLASPKDIAALKINAIEGRGSMKDFIDVYLLLQHYSLAEILEFYARKYPNHSIFRALLSLTYFEDADIQVMPEMFVDIDWDQIKAVITEAVVHYQQQ